MRIRSLVMMTLMVLSGSLVAQTAPGLASSHGSSMPTMPASAASANGGLQPMTQDQMAAKVAIRVNGAEITELDVRREMVTIFPYAVQHNGFPKDMEPQIRGGAVEMIIFEELLYQDAKRRGTTVSPERLAKAEATFRRQFPGEAQYQRYLKVECKGSEAILKEKIRRSLLIEKMLKLEVADKAVITPAMVREYYNKNGKEFEHGETVNIQTISIIPPQGAQRQVEEDARKKAQEIHKKAKQAKNYEQFGLLAEDVSDDDWHTHMGERRTMNMKDLPPMVATAIAGMKVGEVSELIQVGNAWVIVRLMAHAMPGKTPFPEVQKKLTSDLQKQKTVDTRAALDQKLRKDAKIEVL